MHFGPPKSDAGRRMVVIPPMIIHDLRTHLASVAPHDADALAFTSPGGKLLRHGNFPPLDLAACAGRYRLVGRSLHSTADRQRTPAIAVADRTR